MATLAGIVLRDSQPVERAYVRLYGPSGEFVSERYTPADGRFRFYVVPGTWTLEVRAVGVEAHRETVQVGQGDVDLPLRVTSAEPSSQGPGPTVR